MEITLVLILITTAAGVGFWWLSHRKLEAMSEEERSAEQERRQERKAARSQRWKDWETSLRTQQADQKAKKLATARRVRQDISKVADRSAGTLACPRCGGTNFKAKRSRGAKIALVGAGIATLGAAGVAGAALAPKTRVRCITCGTEYLRG